MHIPMTIPSEEKTPINLYVTEIQRIGPKSHQRQGKVQRTIGCPEMSKVAYSKVFGRLIASYLK